MNIFVVGHRPSVAPEGWSACRIKDATTFVNRGVAPTYSEEETGVVAFSQKCVRADRSIDLSLGRPVVADEALSDSDARLRAHDIVVNSTGTGTLGRAGCISEGALTDNLTAIADGHVTLLRADERVVVARYLWYLLSTEAFYDTANVCLAVGSTNQMELGRESIRQLGITLPPIGEQRQIVLTLDEETDRIDRLVDEETSLRQLVVDRRMAEIDRLIERGGTGDGLEPVASPWLEALPDTWQLMPLKHCVDKVTVGIVVNPSHYYENDGVPVLRGLNIRPERVNQDDLVFMSATSNEYHAKSRLRDGDVVVVRTGDAGSAAVVPGWAVGGNIVDLLLIRPGGRMRPKFLELLINSRLVQRQVSHGSVGALQAHFNTGALSNVMVVVPPLPEQDRILAHLNVHLDRYDRLIAEIEFAVARLQEHRQALVTAGVSRGIGAIDGAA